MGSRSRNDRGIDRSICKPFLAKFNGHRYGLLFGINELVEGRKMGRKRAIFAQFCSFQEDSGRLLHRSKSSATHWTSLVSPSGGAS